MKKHLAGWAKMLTAIPKTITTPTLTAIATISLIGNPPECLFAEAGDDDGAGMEVVVVYEGVTSGSTGPCRGNN